MDIVERLRDSAMSTRSADRIVCDQAADEIERLRNMVKDAYNDGFHEGMREVLESKGGIPWFDSRWRREFEEKK